MSAFATCASAPEEAKSATAYCQCGAPAPPAKMVGSSSSQETCAQPGGDGGHASNHLLKYIPNTPCIAYEYCMAYSPTWTPETTPMYVHPFPCRVSVWFFGPTLRPLTDRWRVRSTVQRVHPCSVGGAAGRFMEEGYFCHMRGVGCASFLVSSKAHVAVSTASGVSSCFYSRSQSFRSSTDGGSCT